ncbi:MAG TPA: bifunctional phosphoribosylaminoimidazolecarboxamide formyltransferase/IMP cyclohydrolase [Rhodothermales bacterium]|nr:bifunctional phosphoribosylaminoimidazolecarboxamide formyltransferase/IMP cyclohydrolase [Rhodothermales bacterium]
MVPSKTLPPLDALQPVRRALLSVSDKTGLEGFARRLAARGVELVSTGGTAQALRAAGLAVRDVSELTGFPELMDGRVKTLHPAVHAGLLARRNDPDDRAALDAQGFSYLDLVVVNLYPFARTVSRGGVTDDVACDNVDIGGPTMLRAAAKNFAAVAAVVDPADYAALADELDQNDGHLSLATRRRLAGKVFAHTSSYDLAIADYLAGTPAASDRGPQTADGGDASDPEDPTPTRLVLDLPKAQPMRYGENPHQAAALYGDPSGAFTVLHGKALSYNNLLDLSAALGLVAEFAAAPPTVAILKHTNPCGVGTANSLAAAYGKAFATDTQSPFGGIVVVNRPLDRAAAEAIDAVFTELIVAPDFEEDVLDFLQQKANRRLIRYDAAAPRAPWELRSVAGGVLVQAPDGPLAPFAEARADWQVVTRRAPTEAEWADLDFAWRVGKHVKSNAIVYARDGATLGVGAGQMSRIDASEIAVAKGRKGGTDGQGLDFMGCAVASDAFFPFPDGLLAAAAAGAACCIQPGGSVRDEAVIAAADERGMAMVFTGKRHFRH